MNTLLVYALQWDLNRRLGGYTLKEFVRYVFARRINAVGDQLPGFKAAVAFDPTTCVINFGRRGRYTPILDQVRGLVRGMIHNGSTQVTRKIDTTRYLIPATCKIVDNHSDRDAVFHMPPIPDVPIIDLWPEGSGPKAIPFYKPGGKKCEWFQFLADEWEAFQIMKQNTGTAHNKEQEVQVRDALAGAEKEMKGENLVKARTSSAVMKRERKGKRTWDCGEAAGVP